MLGWLYRKLWRVRRVQTKDQALRSIRDHSAALGVRLDDLTDEQIERGVAQVGRAAAAAGVPAATVVSNLMALTRATKAAANVPSDRTCTMPDRSR